MYTAALVAQMLLAQTGSTFDWTSPTPPPAPIAEIKRVVAEADWTALAEAFPKTRPRATKPVVTTQVVMVTQANCPPCRQAEAECARAGVRFGPSRSAQYRLVDISDGGRYAVSQTPTFIVLANGVEVQRYDSFPGVQPLKKAYYAAQKTAKATAMAPAMNAMAMGALPLKSQADVVRQWAALIMGETGDITVDWTKDRSATIPLGENTGLSLTLPKNLRVRYKWANGNLSLATVGPRPALRKRGIPFGLGVPGMTLTPTSIKMQIDWISDPSWTLTD